MGKENLTFEILKLKKINFTAMKVLFFLKDVDIGKLPVSYKFLLKKKSIDALLITFIMTIKLSRYI